MLDVAELLFDLLYSVLIARVLADVVTARVSRGSLESPVSTFAYLILIAGRPAAELSLITMLRGTDLVPVLR